MVMKPTTQYEVEILIKYLPNKEIHGHDMISNTLLKSLGNSISLSLTIIFNQSISEGIFPDQMKIAEIIPLFKGKGSDQPVNYRPISLLLTMSKLLEKIIYKCTIRYIDKYKILYDSQYGFHLKRSCEQAILELIGNILDSKNDKTSFLDLSKAFDTLGHDVLLKKLDIYGIQGTFNDWFRNYLHNRSLVCKLNTVENKTIKSDIYNIAYGTAQGSCLGPLLFILFTNDIHLLTTYSKIILFVDDTTLYSHHRKIQFLKYMMEHDMNMLINWFKANQLSLNVEKTRMIKFWPNKIPFEVNIENMSIINSKSTKFLGIIIDENLTWSDHVNALNNKLLSNKRLLLNAKKILSDTILQHIYYPHIYSHPMYSLSIWGSMITKRMENTLYKLQTECIKILSNKEKEYPQKGLYTQYSLQLFPTVIKQELIKLGYKISKNYLPTLIKNLYIKEGRKQHKYPTRSKDIPNVQ